METCEAVAWACAAAQTLDAATPRPGLTSLTRPQQPRQNPWPWSYTPPAAYEACLCSCRLGQEMKPGWTRCWLAAVKKLARLGENTAMGSLLLQTLQAAATGAAEAKQLHRVEHVMGHTRILLEAEGAEGAGNLYKALRLLNPSYLARISYSGLPDATDPTETPQTKQITLAEIADTAAAYDPVLREAARHMQTSLGPLLDLARRLHQQGETPTETMKQVTLQALALEGDLLLRRKLGPQAEAEAAQLAREAAHNPTAEARLWRLLKHAGPGSAADLAANTMARLAYEKLREGYIGSIFSQSLKTR